MAKIILTPRNDKKLGTAEADFIDGKKGNDTITGMSGNDTLIGGSGNDNLDGGTDNDSLSGGAGADTLLGGSGNDLLDGGTDNDKLDGGAGNDTLIGGTGMDTMLGGDGNDFYMVDHLRDVVTEKMGILSGIDTVTSTINYTLPANVENLTLAGLANLTGTGNDEKNLITGNAGDNYLDGGSNFDTLIGGGGADTLQGGTSVDRLIGGDGSDTYIINSNEDTIVETKKDGDQDVVISSISYELDDYLEVLLLTGTAPIDGTGNELDNIIDGNELANFLSGEEGSDIINGNGGADSIDGGAGDDTINGGEGNDSVFYQGYQDDYKIFQDSGIWIVQDVNDTRGDGIDEGTDQITDIETLIFADGDKEIGQKSEPILPSLTISGDKTTLKIGETTTLNFEFNIVPSDFSANDISVSGGTLGDLSTDASGKLYTAQFTPTIGSNHLNATISVAAESYRDPSGNNGTASNILTIGGDTLAPDLAISSDKINFKVGETATLTFDFSETPSDFDTMDIVATGGVMSNLKSDPVDDSIYTALFTPTADTNHLTGTISVPMGSYRDVAGNDGLASNTLTIDGDTLTPNLTISSDKTTFNVGESATLTFNFSEQPIDFDNSDLIAIDGTVGPLNGTGLTRTAVFTPTANINDLNSTVSVAADSYTDLAGNGGAASNVLDMVGDTANPHLSITSTKTRFKSGDTANFTFTFDEAPNGFTADDITVSGGTLSGFAVIPDNDQVYTALFTPDYIAPGVPKVTTVLKESANGGYGVTSKDYTLVAGGGTFTLNYQMYGIPDKAEIYVDSVLMTSTNGFVSYTGSLTILGSKLFKGSVVTVVMTGNNRGTAWDYNLSYSKGVLDPTDPASQFNGAISVAADTYTDQAGNHGLASNTLTLKGDLLAPDLEIDISQASFRAGQAADVTFTFEEAPVGFTLQDVSVKGGNLSNFTTTDAEGRIYTALFTPVADQNTLKGLIQVPAGSYTDKVGNSGDQSNLIELSGDTLVPTLSSITPSDDATAVAVGSNLVLNFSEYVKAGTGDIVISNDNGDVRTISVTDINQVIFSGSSVTLNPRLNLQAGSSYHVQMASGVIRDMAGNSYAGMTDTTVWNFTTVGNSAVHDNTIHPDDFSGVHATIDNIALIGMINDVVR